MADGVDFGQLMSFGNSMPFAFFKFLFPEEKLTAKLFSSTGNRLHEAKRGLGSAGLILYAHPSQISQI